MTVDPSITPAPSRPGRLRVGVVGAGRVGAVLAAALAQVGHRVVAASGVSERSRDRAEVLLPGVPVVTPPEVCEAADLVLLTVPDDVLPGLVAGLAVTGAFRPGQLVLHTSGRFGLQVLAPATEVGALPLALHPVMTFTGTSVDLARLPGCVFGVTAPPALTPVADALVLEMEGEPEHVPEDKRVLYHAGLAHASNHLVSLVGSAMEVLTAAGIERPDRLLAPLLSATLDNALRTGDRALTGPVARGDAGTVAAHLEALAEVSDSTHDLYLALARVTADRALASGLLDAQTAESLLDVLAGEGPAR